MAKQTINIGTNQDDGTGDLLRVAFNKVNDNFTEIYNELGGTALSSLSFNANVISTDTTNQDIVLSPSGAGEVDISADTLIRGALVVTGQSRSNNLQVDTNAQIDGTLNVTGAATFGAITIGSTIASDLNVSGAVTVGGLFTANGSVDLGDTSADTITYVGRVDSSIVPSVTQNNDLGSATLKWRDLYARDLDVRNITASGNVTIGGNITIGDSTTDSITVEADFASNIIPNTDSTYSVGSDAKRYLNVFGDYVHALDFRSADISISAATIQTLTTNTDLTLDAQGTGNVVATTLEVSDLTAGRVVTATTDGRLQDSAGLTWDGTTLGATQLTVDTITINQNEISSNSTNANIVLSPNQSGIVEVRSNIDASSNNIINVADPSNAQDAATKNYIDTQNFMTTFGIVDDSSTANYITNGEILGIKGGTDISTLISGDTVTISNGSTLDTLTARGASTTNAVALNGGLTVTTISASGNITTTQDISSDQSIYTTGIEIYQNNIFTRNSNANLVLNPSGTGAIDASTAKIINVGTPTANSDAATKNYVDTSTTLDSVTSNGATTTNAVTFNGGATGTTFTATQSLFTSGIEVFENNIFSSNSNDDIGLIPSGTGNVFVDGAIRMQQQAGDPVTDASSGYIYVKDDSGAEVHVKDGAGNVTKISPHNSQGEWEYYSVNKHTGKTVRINMERMIRKLEQLTGETFIETD